MANVSNEPILVKTMRDGSKRYRVEACPRCNGKGRIYGFGHVYNGICFKCNGSGYAPYEYVEKSEARLEKEKQKNIQKLIGQSEEHNNNFLKWNGFNADGKAYAVLGDTYPIKDELKSMGAKFDHIMGWKLPEDTDKYPTVEIDIHEIVNEDENTGWWSFKSNSEIEDYFNKVKKANEPEKNDDDLVSDYVGNIGERITVDITIKKISSFESHYSYYGETNYLYKFEDSAGNIYTWKTSGGLDNEVNGKLTPMQEGDTCTIAGTVKDHKEYKGDKETVLTRVKKL